MKISVKTSVELDLPSGFSLADIERVYAMAPADENGFTVQFILRGDEPMYTSGDGRRAFHCDDMAMANDVAAAIRVEAEAARAGAPLAPVQVNPMHPQMTEIDLSATTSRGGAGLEVGPTYLVLYDGRFHVGRFSMLWYGLSFEGYTGAAQYDPPGANYSSWQRVWRLDNAGAISAAAEPDYAIRRRAYAIGRMKSNGQLIDETAPIEAFLYLNMLPAMPKRPDSDEDGEGEDG